MGWVGEYLIKRALGEGALSAKMNRPLSPPSIVPEVRTLSDVRVLEELFNNLPPSPKRVSLRRMLARLGVRNA